jgi:hypothetical protein
MTPKSLLAKRKRVKVRREFIPCGEGLVACLECGLIVEPHQPLHLFTSRTWGICPRCTEVERDRKFPLP